MNRFRKIDWFLVIILVLFLGFGVFQANEAPNKYGKDLTLKVYYQIITDYGLKSDMSKLEHRFVDIYSSLHNYYGIKNENVPCPSAAQYLPRLKTGFYLGWLTLYHYSLPTWIKEARSDSTPIAVVGLVKSERILSLYFNTNISYAKAIKQYPLNEMVRGEAGDQPIIIDQPITLNYALDQAWRGRNEYLKLLPADKLALIQDGFVMYRRINTILLSLGFTTKQIDDFIIMRIYQMVADHDDYIPIDYNNPPNLYFMAYIIAAYAWLIPAMADYSCYQHYLYRRR